jgi:hypothetical protein
VDINLIADSSVSSAPAGFIAAVQAAADIFDEDFPGNYTVNIRYGWGTWNNAPDSALTNPNSGDFSVGGPIGSTTVSYATALDWLTAYASLSDEQTAVASLPASFTDLPGDADSFFVSSAEEKALGVLSGTNGAVDGAIGFNVGDTNDSSDWTGAALTEIAHALGWMTDYYTGEPTIADLFRYRSSGHYEWTGGQPAYFSIDGGATDLANFATSFDYTLFSKIANDALSAPVTPSTHLTSLDIEALNVIGFGASRVSATASGQSFSVGLNQAEPISSYITLSNPAGDDVTSYAFYDAGGGNGHFTNNGTPIADGQWLTVSASDLGDVDYVGGSSPQVRQTLEVGVYDATTATWSAANSFVAGTKDTTARVIGHNFGAGEDQSVAVSPNLTVSNPLSDTISQYAFYDAGGGRGHFTNNGTAVPDGQWTYTSDLGDIDYVGGSMRAAQTIDVELYDATTGAWSRTDTFVAHTVRSAAAQSDAGDSAGGVVTISDGGGAGVTISGGAGEFGINEDTSLILSSLPIATGTTAEISSAYQASVAFAGSTGTLILDDSQDFAGTVSGLTGQDTLDLRDIGFGSIQTPSYAGTGTGGTLAVTDGTHTADINLLGNYVGASFVASSDDHGGTLLALHG